MGVVSGDDKGNYNPESKLTRAELIKIALKLFNVEVQGEVTEKPFKDVDLDKWYAPYISAAKEKGIAGGYEDGTFKPNSTVSRVEALKILLEASKKEITGGKMEFSDTKQGQWYEKYVAFATFNSIVGGYPNGTFKPNNPITRAEIAKIAAMTYAVVNPPLPD